MYLRKMGQMLLILYGLALLGGLEVVSPAKILFLYPVPYPSHYKAFSPLIEELANRGHHITAYTGFGRQRSDKNYTEISITGDKGPVRMRGLSIVSRTSWSAIALINDLWRHFPPIMEASLQSKGLQELMNSSEKFDLLIVEATCMEESLLAFSHKFSAPVVNLHPFFPSPFQAQLMGIPHAFPYIPNTWSALTDHMTFWQRTRNTLVGMYEIVAGNWYYLPMQERMMRKYFNYSGSETLPPLKELIANISLHLVDSHPFMSYVRPYSPNVIDVAGMNVKTAGKLPQDLQNFMDDAKEGVIYISFGSYIDASMFSKQVKDVFSETMKGLKQRVIWKWSETVDAPNILTRPWLPQQEILAHPNCKLFITHGGFNSLSEATRSGVPVIGIPFFADQYFNVAYYEYQGIGLEIVLESITALEFRNTINAVLKTPSFGENAKRLATIVRDEPQSSLEKAVFWVEYVIRHKGAHHLKPASLKMPYYQYLLLDVISFLAIALSIVYYTLYYFVCKFTCLLFYSTQSVSEGKKYK